MKEKSRSTFSGNIGFVLAAAGSAVGLGNMESFRIWQQRTEEDFSAGVSDTCSDLWLLHCLPLRLQ